MNPQSSNPWDWHQPHDTARLGEVIHDRREQERWCRATVLGGLPYIWRVMAPTVRDLAYDKLDLRQGDRVLMIGESIASCGFDADIRALVGPSGSVEIIDITDQARDAYFKRMKGRGGQLATWNWDYSRKYEDEAFDCVVVMQAVTHTDDWRETGADLLRVMRKGRNIVLAEITISPETRMVAQIDVHIDYWLKKIFAPVGFSLDEFPYYSPADLKAAFAGQVVDAGSFSWRGIDVFWGTKP